MNLKKRHTRKKFPLPALWSQNPIALHGMDTNTQRNRNKTNKHKHKDKESDKHLQHPQNVLFAWFMNEIAQGMSKGWNNVCRWIQSAKNALQEGCWMTAAVLSCGFRMALARYVALSSVMILPGSSLKPLSATCWAVYVRWVADIYCMHQRLSKHKRNPCDNDFYLTAIVGLFI